MEIIFRQLNPHACRTYLVGTKGANEIVLIDPVLEHVKDYLELLDREKLQLTHVIDTHTHADHLSGGAALKDQTDCEYVMHTRAPAHCVSFHITDGFAWHLGDLPVKIMHTPGHTKDSVTLIFLDRILVGDVLFLDDGGAGRDDLPGGDPGEHWDSLQRILTLPDHLVVYPAHEYRNRQPSSLAEQKKRNPFLKPRSKEEYVKFLEDLKLGPADWMKDVLKANYACARDPHAAWIPVDAPACEVKGTLAHSANDLQVATIPPQEVKRRLDEHKTLVLLDVREEQELTGELGHLPGVKHIPIGSLTGRLWELEECKEADLVTICRSGGRAHSAAQILMQAGFKSVYVMAGGMTAWTKAGFPVEFA
jgi:glyoxylase-like metal-dependent hydrolase (beta-lactamase superfamily II)/rhodanese-related sulfurtransferase